MSKSAAEIEKEAAETALVEIKRYADAGRVHIDPTHARPRMNQRGATWHDVINALKTASSCKRSKDHPDRWVTPGVDLDGDTLTCVVKFELNLLVITVF